MPRQIKDREMNIVHFSFFDLLFGAFGAFVFLMIIQVISTMSLVDAGAQKLIDQTVKEKQQIKAENNRLKGAEASLASLQARYEKLLEGHKEQQEVIVSLQQKLGGLDAQIKQAQEQAVAAAQTRQDLEQAHQQAKALQAQLDQARGEKAGLDRQVQGLKATAAELEGQVAQLRKAVKQGSQQGQVLKGLEDKIARLEKDNQALGGQRDQLDRQIAQLQARLKEMDKVKVDDKRKGDVITTLEAKNKELTRILEDTRAKIAAQGRAPLEIATVSLPTLLTGEDLNLALAAQGGSPPYTWDVEGHLPEGVVFDRTKGALVGQATQPEERQIRLRVSDALGVTAKAQEDLAVKVVARPEQKARVSIWFLVMAAISSLLLAKILWDKHKANKAYKMMLAQGYELVWRK